MSAISGLGRARRMSGQGGANAAAVAGLPQTEQDVARMGAMQGLNRRTAFMQEQVARQQQAEQVQGLVQLLTALGRMRQGQLREQSMALKLGVQPQEFGEEYGDRAQSAGPQDYDLMELMYYLQQLGGQGGAQLGGAYGGRGGYR